MFIKIEKSPSKIGHPQIKLSIFGHYFYNNLITFKTSKNSNF